MCGAARPQVWFGGDVAEGGLFHGGEARGTQEVILLHSLDCESDAEVERLSMPIIRGVHYTTLEGAKSLVDSGRAQKADFQLFVGCGPRS